ncbi:MAG: gluconate 2-dehydrogenase subunit 3 family protein [Pseudomonadales bacterium]|jgi:gluconate 2-dehydrogenase gamma chain|nr:gluconate 2-dehydrogenase subunit 3 family protein [Pseudomonadales bacterium]
MGKFEESGLSRRAFVQGAGAAAGTSLLRLSAPALAAAAQIACSRRDAAGPGAPFVTLGAEEAATLEAIAARILPSTDTPGAREAGVIHFFDTVLGGPMADALPSLREGLATFAPDGAAFRALGETEQDAWLAAREDSPFFAMVRSFTIMGFFAMSSYGGNRDGVGWEVINFAGHGAASYPFGYYDAEYRGEPWDEAARQGGTQHGH